MGSEAIVVGAGIEGSAIAYQLAKRGLKKVVLMEQVRTLVVWCYINTSKFGS